MKNYILAAPWLGFIIVASVIALLTMPHPKHYWAPLAAIPAGGAPHGGEDDR
jgi:hypothetical protein